MYCINSMWKLYVLYVFIYRQKIYYIWYFLNDSNLLYDIWNY